MSTLSDRIDALAATARAIRTAADQVVPGNDPFTRAVLDTPLGDLIRDVDASELGLFTLVPPPDADVRTQPDNAPRRGEISRVEFPGATPLRKQPVKRGDIFKPKEYEPEVYAHAALKYLDRYQSIRQMPRARAQAIAIIEQLDDTRENIRLLNETLQELTRAGAASGPTPPISGVAEEERRITDLQNRLAELRNQKDAILRSNDSRPAKSKPASKPVPKPVLSPSPEPENPEDAFWSTPAASARTLRFTDRLLGEEPDFAELSAISVDSPGPAPPKSVFARLAAGSASTNKGLDNDNSTEDDVFGGPRTAQKGNDEDPADDLRDQSVVQHEPEPEASFLEAPDTDPEDNPDEERTVVFSKVSASGSTDQPPLGQELSPTNKIPKVRITPELENIIASTRIWNTVGDTLLPGKGGEKPLQAKETLALIESLATGTPSPGSPASSISSVTSATAGPTTHQVNTAQLLYALLMASNHAMPLNQLKTAIGSTRSLYACVAKKLIRIDRGGGEQIVLFDA